MLAERIKSRPPSPAELQLPLAVREHRIEMKRLYLELFPPLISVTTLIIVTIGVVKEAWGSLFGDVEKEDDVNAGLMLIFSFLNLLLDVVNVTCFAKAHQAYGLQTTCYDNDCHNQQPSAQVLDDDAEELNGLNLLEDSDPGMSGRRKQKTFFERLFGKVNLNMCSAWTVSYYALLCYSDKTH